MVQFQPLSAPIIKVQYILARGGRYLLDFTNISITLYSIAWLLSGSIPETYMVVFPVIVLLHYVLSIWCVQKYRTVEDTMYS